MSEENQMHSTHRTTIDELEKILHNEISVLDHGFIRVIDYMGSDSAIVQAARVSYGKGTKQTSQDKALISYLMRHRHTTPFEMCEIKLHIKLPIFVARQWIRHRTGSFNEYSARYSILGNEFYLPEKNIISSQSQTNKQGRSTKSVSDEIANKVLNILSDDATTCYQHYLEMLNEDADGNVINDSNVGITRELARMNLTLNYYTEWYWKTNLHNLFHFLSLRSDHHAQYEIRVYAEAIMNIVKSWVPYAYEAFEEYRMKGVSISRKGLQVIKQKLKGIEVTQESSGIGKREWDELMEILK